MHFCTFCITETHSSGRWNDLCTPSDFSPVVTGTNGQTYLQCNNKDKVALQDTFHFEQAKQASPVRYVFPSRALYSHYVFCWSVSDLQSTATGSSGDDLGSVSGVPRLADLVRHSEYNLILFQQSARLSASFRHSSAAADPGARLFRVPIPITSPSPLPCPFRIGRKAEFSFGRGSLWDPTGPHEQGQLNYPAAFP